MNVLDYPVLTAPSTFDREDAVTLNKKIHKIAKEHQGKIGLDLNRVSVLTSSSLGILIHTWKTLDNGNNSLVIINPSDTVMSILKNTNLEKIFKIEYGTY